MTLTLRVARILSPILSMVFSSVALRLIWNTYKSDGTLSVYAHGLFHWIICIVPGTVFILTGTVIHVALSTNYSKFREQKLALSILGIGWIITITAVIITLLCESSGTS